MRMAIWDFGKSKNFEAEQAARVAVFNKIAPEGNWKLPIDAVIKESEFADCNDAAIWFTGGPLTIVKRSGDWVRVVGAGYYSNVGA